MLRACLVDDEEHALTIMELFLGRIGGVEVVGRFRNAFEVLEGWKALQPDVFFLDIEMPGMYGVELAEIIKNDNPDMPIVFVTAYDRYAISAFEQEAMDYILKPLELDRLTKTVHRLQREACRLAAAGNAAHAQPIAEQPAQLRIMALGGFDVCNEQGERVKWRTGKAKELFAYLAVNTDTRVHRDVLLEALWPEEHYQKAKVYLHTCVSYLRNGLKRVGFTDVILYEDEKYFLQQRNIASDLQELKQGLAGLRGSKEAPREELERLSALYRGALLQNEDYVWAEQEGGYLERSMTEIRLSLATEYAQQGDYAAAIETAKRMIADSPYNEEAYRILIAAYRQTGKPEEAVRAFQRLADELKELHVEPSEQTRRALREEYI